MDPKPRNHDDTVHGFVSPWLELNAGLWSLFGGATILLALRLWVKVTRRYGFWYDDWILVVSWMILLATDILIVYQFATGYILPDSKHKWDDRMHILINISSCGNSVGQALSKTAFAVTLLRMCTNKKWHRWFLWFCIITMNAWMIAKVVLQWAKVCGKPSYQNWYRMDVCIGWDFRQDFKEGGNVYNIIMDFLFASFPWLVLKPLDMRKIEKIGLCITMSLGMIVAIVAAIRVSWKDGHNPRDEWYIWRNGVSQVWYSSEVAGTIMVQCIPILRPLLRDIHTSLTSRKLSSNPKYWTTTVDENNYVTVTSKITVTSKHRASLLAPNCAEEDRMELRNMDRQSSRGDSDLEEAGIGRFDGLVVQNGVVTRVDAGGGKQSTESQSRDSLGLQAETSRSDVDDAEQGHRHGLSPLPKR